MRMTKATDTVWALEAIWCSPWFTTSLPQHPHEHRPERPVLLAADQRSPPTVVFGSTL
jgi:hypothetical protein